LKRQGPPLQRPMASPRSPNNPYARTGRNETTVSNPQHTLESLETNWNNAIKLSVKRTKERDDALEQVKALTAERDTALAKVAELTDGVKEAMRVLEGKGGHVQDTIWAGEGMTLWEHLASVIDYQGERILDDDAAALAAQSKAEGGQQ